MSQWIVLVATIVATGCAPRPVVMTENLPHYVMIFHEFGPMDADHTVPVAADTKADDVCRSHGRVAKLPARTAECAAKHLFLRYCMGYKYTYECVEE